MFWNVENLFDTQDDSLRNDDAFTPTGDNHWTYGRYLNKQNRLCQTIAAMGIADGGSLEVPLLVGLAEVENDIVLRELVNGTSLRKFDYGFVHFDSPDRRGIDVALLYRRSLYTPFHVQPVNVSDSTRDFFTRDILLVEGCTREGDTLIAIVVHLPSKRGGSSADKNRLGVAQTLRMVMDTVSVAHPNSAIVVMGDFNASPGEPEMRKGLANKNRKANFVNLMASIDAGRGSYKYQDQWTCLDQIIVSENMVDSSCAIQVRGKAQIFDAGFLLLDDEKFLGKKVFRTYTGMKYNGGYSDHLPVYIDIETNTGSTD